MSRPTRVLVVRGHLATPWELRPWTRLPDRFEVAYLRTPGNDFPVDDLPLAPRPARSVRDRIKPRGIGVLATTLAGDRYLDAAEHYAWADVVHAEELSFWFAADAARARRDGGAFRLVQTVWETLPFLDAYRNPPARRFRADVLGATDLFLPATERARDALRLEGVDDARIAVCPPGIDLGRFGSARTSPPPAEHVVLSPGRLVWEKGHHDVLRAVAALRRGLVPSPAVPRVRLVGRGPEEERLRAHADELGIGDLVDIGAVPYAEMPAVFAGASAMVLASLPSATAGLHPFDRPRAFWEEQFGLVLAEAMAAGLPIVAARSGAIPEVVGSEGASFVDPGDWMGIARALAAGPLATPPGTRVAHDPARVARYSLDAMAARLAGAYDRVLADG